PSGLAITTADGGYAKIAWQKSETFGINGGYVDADKVSYKVYRKNDETHAWDSIAIMTDAYSFVDENYVIPSGYQQAHVTYAVSAVNEKGSSPLVSAGFTMGIPYSLPYVESFEYATLMTYPWTLTGANGVYYDEYTSWIVFGRTGLARPVDGDCGLLTFTNPTDEVVAADYESPRIKMEKGAVLSFFMYHGIEADPENVYMDVLVAKDDDLEAEKICSLDYNNGETGWVRHVVSLASCEDADNIRVILRGKALDGSASIYFDKMKVEVEAEQDIAIESCDIPSRVTVGKDGTVKATVRNMGASTVNEYTVKLLCDDVVVDSKEGVALDVNKTADFSFLVSPTIEKAGKAYSYKVVVACESDGKSDNDVSETVALYVAGPQLPTVDGVSGATSHGKIVLTWNVPNNEVVDAVTDSFEDYEEFIIDGIGDWTVYDGDKYETLYYSSAPEVANYYAAKAWWVWNSYDAGFKNTETVKAHTGSQQLAAFSAGGVNSSYETVSYPNRNWLISPEITPGSDVSFYVSMATAAYGPETFQVLYSTTDQNYKSFTVLGEGEIQYPGWTEYAYTLPKDAKYFAILHNTRDNSQVLFLDDVTYTPLYGSTTELNFQGYNIYCDGMLVANCSDNTYSIETIKDGMAHTYQISVVWAEGESMLSNVYTVSGTTGILVPSFDGVSITTANGQITLVSDKPLNASVYTLDAHLVGSMNVDGTSSMAVRSGVYVVRFGDKSLKINVR
nr:choice-of-anchor J domain-containing protein [Bacteroidaceae bacterium]